MSFKAFRSGETSPKWSDDPYDEKIVTRHKRLDFEFSMPSKGGGVTEVSLRVSPDSFEDVAKAMLTAGEDEAIRAFGAALHSRKSLHSN
jgi:hypothetical protein